MLKGLVSIRRIGVKILVLSAIVFYSCGSYKIYNLKDASGVEIEDHGLIYALPKTVIRIEVEASHVEFKSGPYAKYAGKYLGIANVPEQDSVTWLISDVHINSYPVPDPNHYYCVETDANFHALLFNLSEYGFLTSVGGERGREIASSETDLFLNQVFNQPIELSQLPVMDAQTERIDTTYRTIITDTSFLRIPVMRKQQVNKSLEEKAEEIANLILELREEKVALLIGDMNEFPDGKALEIIINEFREIEEQYLPLFTGTRTEKVFKTVYEFIPSINNQASKNVLFRFSPKMGILSNTNLTGSPVMIEVVNQEFTTEFLPYQFHKDTLIETGTGLVYRIPDEAVVRIVDGSKVIATQKLPIAQYGKINCLPKSLLTKKGLQIDFYPESGALKAIGKTTRN